MLRKIKKLWAILRYFFTDEDNLLLHLIEMKAYESLNDCAALEVGSTEDIEDLIFHVKTYYDIPNSIALTKYPHLKGVDISKMMVSYKKGRAPMSEVLEFTDFLNDIEVQRAIEREIIFDRVKGLSFGFRL